MYLLEYIEFIDETRRMMILSVCWTYLMSILQSRFLLSPLYAPPPPPPLYNLVMLPLITLFPVCLLFLYHRVTRIRPSILPACVATRLVLILLYLILSICNTYPPLILTSFSHSATLAFICMFVCFSQTMMNLLKNAPAIKAEVARRKREADEVVRKQREAEEPAARRQQQQREA